MRPGHHFRVESYFELTNSEVLVHLEGGERVLITDGDYYFIENYESPTWNDYKQVIRAIDELVEETGGWDHAIAEAKKAIGSLFDE